jgi:hypothetical protein
MILSEHDSPSTFGAFVGWLHLSSRVKQPRLPFELRHFELRRFCWVVAPVVARKQPRLADSELRRFCRVVAAVTLLGIDHVASNAAGAILHFLAI